MKKIICAASTLTMLLVGHPVLAKETGEALQEKIEDARYFACREAPEDTLEPILFQPREEGGYAWSKYPQIMFEEVGDAMIGRLEDTYYRFDPEKYVVIDWVGNVVQGECVLLTSVIRKSLGELTKR